MSDETQTGLSPHVAGLLCYLLGWVTGIIFYIIEKDNFVRFHAIQSIITFGILTVVEVLLSWLFLFSYGWIWYLQITLNWLVNLLTLVLWVLLMVKAYQGERYKLPWVGNIAEKYSE
jgi:uncharacterized membrane protein